MTSREGPRARKQDAPSKMGGAKTGRRKHGVVAAGFNFVLNCSFAALQLATKELAPQVSRLMVVIIVVQVACLGLVLTQGVPLIGSILDKARGVHNVNHFFTLVWLGRQWDPSVRTWFVAMAHEQMKQVGGFNHLLIGSGAADGIIMSIGALVTEPRHFRVVHWLHALLHCFTLRSAMATMPLPIVSERVFTPVLHAVFILSMPLVVSCVFWRSWRAPLRAATAQPRRPDPPHAASTPVPLPDKTAASIAKLHAVIDAVRSSPYQTHSVRAGRLSGDPRPAMLMSTMSVKFHDRELSDLGSAGVASLQSAVLACAPAGSCVYVGEGCVQVTVDVPDGGADFGALAPGILEGIVAADRGPEGWADLAGRAEAISAWIDGRLVRVHAGSNGEVTLEEVEDGPAAAAAAAPPHIEALSARFLAAGDASRLALRCAGTAEGDRAIVMRFEAGQVAHVEAEGVVCAAGALDVLLPATSAAPGLLWVRVVRSSRPGVDPAATAAVSALKPVAVVPGGPGVTGELGDLMAGVAASHGPGAADALVRDVGEALSPGGGGPSVLPLLDYLAAQGAARALSELLGHLGEAAPRPLLHGAVLQRDLAVVEALLAHGADPTAATEEGLTPLHLAAMEPDGRFLTAVLRAGGEAAAACALHAQEMSGATPQALAAQLGHWGHVEAIHDAVAAKPAAEPPMEPAEPLANRNRWGFADRYVEERFRRWNAARAAPGDALFLGVSALMLGIRALSLPDTLPNPAMPRCRAGAESQFYAVLFPVHIALAAASCGIRPAWTSLYVRHRGRVLVLVAAAFCLASFLQCSQECFFPGAGFEGDSAARGAKHCMVMALFEVMKSLGVRERALFALSLRVLVMISSVGTFVLYTGQNSIGWPDESSTGAILRAVALPAVLLLVAPTAVDVVMEERDRAAFVRWLREERDEGKKKNT